MARAAPRKGGKKNRKHGRNKDFCARYKAEGRQEKNRARKIARDKREKAKAARQETV